MQVPNIHLINKIVQHKGSFVKEEGSLWIGVFLQNGWYEISFVVTVFKGTQSGKLILALDLGQVEHSEREDNDEDLLSEIMPRPQNTQFQIHKLIDEQVRYVKEWKKYVSFLEKETPILEVKRRVPKRVGKSGSLSQRLLVTCHVWRGVI